MTSGEDMDIAPLARFIAISPGIPFEHFQLLSTHRGTVHITEHSKRRHRPICGHRPPPEREMNTVDVPLYQGMVETPCNHVCLRCWRIFIGRDITAIGGSKRVLEAMLVQSHRN